MTHGFHIQPGQNCNGIVIRTLPRVCKIRLVSWSQQIAGFRGHLFHGQRHAQNGIVARKAAVLADIYTLVADVQRREEPRYRPEYFLVRPCLIVLRSQARCTSGDS